MRTAKDVKSIHRNEQIASRELIGNPALLRVAANVKDNRPLQYIEFELSTKYIVNQFGEEKMKFFIVLTKIFPSLDIKSRTKKGVYTFGRIKIDQETEEESE